MLEFGGLSASLDEGSVEVDAKSSAHVTNQGIDVREEFLRENANPQAEMLRRQLRQKHFFKDLSAGVDDAIKIERKELVSKRSETGMINRKLIEEKKIPDLTL